MRLNRVVPLAALLLGAARARAQQAPNRPEGYKDPGTAAVIGLFVPGGGQIWVSGPAERKGLTLLGIAYGSLIAGPVLGVATESAAPFFIAPIGYLGAMLYGVATADDDARAHNRQLGARTALLERVQPILAPAAAGGTRTATAVGLALRF